MFYLDPTDRQLLTIYLDDSQLKQASIADELKVSSASLTKRKQKLQSAGVIVKFTVEVDYRQIGYNTVGYYHIKVNMKDEKSTESMLNSLMGHDNIVEIHEIFGKEHDYLLKIMCKSNEELREIGEWISSLKNVSENDAFTYPIARTLKRNPGVPLYEGHPE